MSSIAITGGATGTGVFSLLAPSTSTNRTLTLPDETGTLQVSGGAVSGTTGTFSGIVAANGGGIQFPATQVPSANANTLDDYEEGTWTPAYYGQTTAGTISYGSRGGTYTKIGNQVTLYLSLVNLTSSSAVGNLGISGLPFACATSNNVRGCYSASFRFYAIDLPNGIANIIGNIDGTTNPSTFNFFCSVDASTWTPVIVQNGSGIYIEGTITYTTSN